MRLHPLKHKKMAPLFATGEIYILMFKAEKVLCKNITELNKEFTIEEKILK